jgi:hypothetical protein
MYSCFSQSPAILHPDSDSHYASPTATWRLDLRDVVSFEMYIAYWHNGLAPPPFPLSVGHLSWVTPSWLHLYSIFATFIDINKCTVRLLNLHVPRSLILCLNGVYIIANASVCPHAPWLDNRRLRSTFHRFTEPKSVYSKWAEELLIISNNSPYQK